MMPADKRRLIALLTDINDLAVPLRDPEPLREIVAELLKVLIRQKTTSA